MQKKAGESLLFLGNPYFYTEKWRGTDFRYNPEFAKNGGADLKEIAPGIIVYDNPYGGSNVTSITTDEGTVVVDSSLFPSKAEQIKTYLKRIMNSEIQLIINTHYHPDHTFGNAGFQSQILCSESTESYFFQMSKSYIRNVINRNALLKKETITIIPPAFTFPESYIHISGNRTIHIERVGGHTPDSTIVWLPKEQIWIVGDLVVHGYHPEIVYDSDINRWLDVLRRLKKEKIKHLVCGHGDVADQSEIDQMVAYLETIRSLQQYKTDFDGILSHLENDVNFRERKMIEILVESLKTILL
jgi:glyoxylase-like metal-dependent hydrolase (beta-lactamase superfamily II)